MENVMKLCLAIFATVIIATPALAEDLTVRPDGGGGWVIDGPPSLNHGSTIEVRPDGGGGYRADRIGKPTITIRPDGGGGYRIDTGSEPIDPALLNALIPPQ